MSIKKNIQDIQNFLDTQPQKVHLVAVSKYHPIKDILSAYNAGQLAFAESKVQDAIKKIESPILSVYQNIHWHFIGQVQTNKIKKICQYFNTIQSVDSQEKLNKISSCCQALNKNINVFLQININDADRYGFSTTNLLESSPQIQDYPNITLNGIMVMLPKINDSVKIIQKCKQAHDFYSSLKTKIPTLKYLSMGMSQDYKIAIKYGSNLIRIGSGIFKES